MPRRDEAWSDLVAERAGSRGTDTLLLLENPSVERAGAGPVERLGACERRHGLDQPGYNTAGGPAGSRLSSPASSGRTQQYFIQGPAAMDTCCPSVPSAGCLITRHLIARHLIARHLIARHLIARS
ncbi:hypothetical protein IU448_01455 [Nocardia flavorosea]|uniref:hypothetical protein n=1 Tax=Nocardia flavorosea TaxID=53429 RepID=UPI0018962C3A|nr:hypothetical protein [Nocardia flavorosea]MBF6347678.1 hypothetical protein [Nocardia flavorosea]